MYILKFNTIICWKLNTGNFIPIVKTGFRRKFSSAVVEVEVAPSTSRKEILRLSDILDFYFYRGCEVIYEKLVGELQYECNGNITESRTRVEDILALIRPSKHVLEVIFPVRQDNGRLELFRGYRIQHNTHKRPCIGGIRLSEKVDRDSIAALAGLNSYICACSHIPFGGSKAGIEMNPSEHSQGELERIIRAFALELFKKGFAGPCTDILCPGLNCGAREMAWITDTYCQTLGHNDINTTACTAGKPKTLGGLSRFSYLSAHCIFWSLAKILEEPNFTACFDMPPGISGKTFILQGYENLGSQLMKCLCNAGARCIGIENGDGILYNDDGIDPEELKEHLELTGLLHTYPGSRPLTKQNVKYEYCDMLILTSGERVITAENVIDLSTKLHFTSPILVRVTRVGNGYDDPESHYAPPCFFSTQKIVVEAANFAITPGANKLLLDHGILVIPDILINCGNLLVAYLERLKNINHVSYGKTFFKYERGVNCSLLESVQDSLTKRFGRCGGPIAMSASHTFYKNMTSPKEDDVVIASLEQAVESTVKNVKKTLHDYHLGSDLRSAAYANAILDIFHVYNEQL